VKKYIIALIILFIIYAIVVNTCPVVTQWDRSVIIALQDSLKGLPLWIPSLMDTEIYASLIVIPIIVGAVYFFKKYLLIDLVLFSSAPLVAYIFNHIFKMIVHRPRPPLELQIVVQPGNYSFVSSHTFITCSLWGLVIYYLLKYCKNKILKYAGITIGILWMGFVGFSRIWLGVHNPTDVLGGYFLAVILLLIYINLIKLIGGKC
jgi:undecaprenyl-diphosphatase